MARRPLFWTALLLAAFSLGLAVLGYDVGARESVDSFCSSESSGLAIGGIDMLVVGLALLVAIVAAVRLRNRAAFVAIVLVLVAGLVDLAAFGTIVLRCPE